MANSGPRARDALSIARLGPVTARLEPGPPGGKSQLRARHNFRLSRSEALVAETTTTVPYPQIAAGVGSAFDQNGEPSHSILLTDLEGLETRREGVAGFLDPISP